MKKLIAVFVLISTLTISAHAETIITGPSLGYRMENFTVRTFFHSIHMGLGFGYIAQNEFTFLFNTGFSWNFNLPICGTLAQFIFGRTFRSQNDKVHLMIGAGIGGIILPYFSVDIPLQLSIDYYFNNKYGISFTINNSIGYVIPLAFKNTFIVSIGPKFKL